MGYVILFLTIACLMMYGMSLGLSKVQERIDAMPCSEFVNFSVQHLPARCLKEYNLKPN